jgi:hypothetical protein
MDWVRRRGDGCGWQNFRHNHTPEEGVRGKWGVMAHPILSHPTSLPHKREVGRNDAPYLTTISKNPYTPLWVFRILDILPLDVA